MLKRTFCHIDGITINTEKLLWDSGIGNWEHFERELTTISTLSKGKIEKIKAELPFSRNALEQNDLSYFKNRLPTKELWRLSPLGKIAYVDIETTGMSRYGDHITLLGIYDGNSADIYIRGQNLHEARQRLQEFDIFVTFNGKQFDLPFIESEFGCYYDAVHLDLRFMLKELGLQGGLKNIERELGIVRDGDICDVDGFEAVNLWRRYQRGDAAALQTLLKYNREDIVNLKTLLEYYIDKKQHAIATLA